MRLSKRFDAKWALLALILPFICSGDSLGAPQQGLPEQSPSFTFIAMGDRTGGPSSGIEVLEKAVDMTNGLDPDLVMTVGDLVEGQCEPKQWDEQADQFRAIMDKLAMPWYPVAGNHDVYPQSGSVADMTDRYRRAFGPTTYSFDHKFAHFVALFSDEALGYHDPAHDQNMSQEQMEWLRTDLSQTDAQQIFVFLHHPRWTKQYEGCNWDEVHRILKDDGRAITVVAGHIHTLRDDGMRDNVHYLTLAMTGGWSKRGIDYASLHHISQFTVRPNRVSITHFPIGSIIPGDAFPGIEYDEIRELQRGQWVHVEGSAGARNESSVTVQIKNPTQRELEFKVSAITPEQWQSSPEILKFTLKPNEERQIELAVISADDADETAPIEIITRAYYPHKHGEIQPVSVKKKVSTLLPSP